LVVSQNARNDEVGLQNRFAPDLLRGLMQGASKQSGAPDYRLEWTSPDDGRVVEMLHGEFSFSKDRVEASLERFKKAKETRTQKSLDDWF